MKTDTINNNAIIRYEMQQNTNKSEYLNIMADTCFLSKVHIYGYYIVIVFKMCPI